MRKTFRCFDPSTKISVFSNEYMIVVDSLKNLVFPFICSLIFCNFAAHIPKLAYNVFSRIWNFFLFTDKCFIFVNFFSLFNCPVNVNVFGIKYYKIVRDTTATYLHIWLRFLKCKKFLSFFYLMLAVFFEMAFILDYWLVEFLLCYFVLNTSLVLIKSVIHLGLLSFFCFKNWCFYLTL